MPDPLSPQELAPLKAKCLEIFQNDPITAFCCGRLISIMSDQWESGQMPTDLHDQLMPIRSELESILSSDSNTHDMVEAVLRKAYATINNLT